MRFDRTRFVLESLNDFLAENEQVTAEIQSYLAQFTLIVFYSEAEQKLSRIVESRLSETGDRKIKKFIETHRGGMLKRIKKRELNDLLKSFDCGDGDIIGEAIGEADYQKYSTAIANRHEVSHARGSRMTLPEIHDATTSAETVFSFVREKLAEPDHSVE